MDEKGSKNAVTSTQESYFRALTTTTVKIEAVNPEPKTSVKEEPKTSVKEEPKTSVKEEPKVQTAQSNHSDLLWKIPLGILLLLAILAVGLYLGKQLGTLPGSTSAPAEGSSASSGAPISAPVSNNNPVTQDWNAVLTSANSNGNFIGDFGGRGNGSVIPTEAVDLGGKTWKVGRALLTYCETASNCYYMFATPGDVLPRAFNVNLYTPEFTGDLAKELQYINTGWNNNANVTWTYWTNN